MSMKTNYVVVVDYEDGQTLDTCCLLGWDNKTDWFDTDTYGFEILNDDGSIKDRTYCCIEIDKWVGVYVGETIDECKSYSDDGNREGYDCTVCQLIETETGYDLKPVSGSNEDADKSINKDTDTFNEFDLDFDEPNDEEYYEDGSELFSLDLSNIEGTIDDILQDLDPSNPDEKGLYSKLLKVKQDKNALEELKSICIDKVCDNDAICNYISDYSISELGNMDGIWNLFGDILRETIYEYFM